MQSTLTNTFPSGSTWSQASGWPSHFEQDVAVWDATAVWGTLAGESTAVFSTGRSSSFNAATSNFLPEAAMTAN